MQYFSITKTAEVLFQYRLLFICLVWACLSNYQTSGPWTERTADRMSTVEHEKSWNALFEIIKWSDCQYRNASEAFLYWLLSDAPNIETLILSFIAVTDGVFLRLMNVNSLMSLKLAYFKHCPISSQTVNMLMLATPEGVSRTVACKSCYYVAKDGQDVILNEGKINDWNVSKKNPVCNDRKYRFRMCSWKPWVQAWNFTQHQKLGNRAKMERSANSVFICQWPFISVVRLKCRLWISIKMLNSVIHVDPRPTILYLS